MLQIRNCTLQIRTVEYKCVRYATGPYYGLKIRAVHKLRTASEFHTTKRG